MTLDLFAASVALQVWRLAPSCRFGMPTRAGSVRAVGWRGHDHCLGCWVEVERQCRLFAEGVIAGRWDVEGYTPGDRQAQAKQRGAA